MIEAFQLHLKLQLEKSGYEVTCAFNGVECLEKIKDIKIDLILLDWMLPKISGIEVCKFIKSKLEIPIIFLTAKIREIDILTWGDFSFRISKWLLKPIFKILARAEKINIENSLELLENNYSEEELRKIINLENSFIQKIRQFIEKEKRFISNASHELITSITIIKGYTEILRWGREDEEIFDNAIDSIENETVRMEELIKALILEET